MVYASGTQPTRHPFSWEDPDVDAFNVALTSSIYAQPEHATCGHPDAWSPRYVNDTSGEELFCIYDCEPSRRHPNKTNSMLGLPSQALRRFGRPFWSSDCEPRIEGRAFSPDIDDEVPPCFIYSESIDDSSTRETHFLRIKPDAKNKEG